MHVALRTHPATLGSSMRTHTTTPERSRGPGGSSRAGAMGPFGEGTRRPRRCAFCSHLGSRDPLTAIWPAGMLPLPHAPQHQQHAMRAAYAGFNMRCGVCAQVCGVSLVPRCGGPIRQSINLSLARACPPFSALRLSGSFAQRLPPSLSSRALSIVMVVTLEAGGSVVAIGIARRRCRRHRRRRRRRLAS